MQHCVVVRLLIGDKFILVGDKCILWAANAKKGDKQAKKLDASQIRGRSNH